MNVFILNTGRCGSTSFIKACKHIDNYSAAHESRANLLGSAHFNYPDNHIEADCRLAWFLGRLEEKYGDNAVYVHLSRNTKDTAKSFTKRYDRGIIKAYKSQILMRCPKDSDPLEVGLDYCETVNANIRVFLRNKNKCMNFSLENAQEDFQKFWQLIKANGNLAAALSEWEIPYNASPKFKDILEKNNITSMGIQKVKRIVKKLPSFIKYA